ncbi:amino acid transporter [Thermocatellispora tengchongensis]|uniref:Amino acid transporter n=1 Tax=Thermocatellispora tengchongensis TaxID=1073253 RepID=A0A840P771_9ACTN|nr:amino acid permease [Thermocatellispora tengchongensis]MBB5131865.1 amino acid transporter [Thermocatellispora tengchongensis]
MTSPTRPAAADSDAAQLAALGYESEFKREMSPWANFSLGFTYLSPVVGVYTLFGFALATGGPPMIWSFLIVGLGQLMVALVFGEVVAQYPVAGGVYPWARRLWGRRWAWMTGWIYLIALLCTIASVSYGAGPYLAAVFGFESTTTATVVCALVILLVATLINFAGTKVLATAAIIGFAAELIGALVVGVWLLATHRVHGLGVLFDSFGAGGEGTYLWAFAAAGLIGIFQYYGFEACGDVAEEVPDPGRTIPTAMRRTIYIGGAAATFVCLALVLSVGDIPGVIAGEDADPVTTLLNDAFGGFGAKVVLAVVLLSFLSCAMSLQAAAGRLAFSYGRDEMIVGSRWLRRFDHKRAVPPYALVVAAVVPALVIVGAAGAGDTLTKIVTFSSVGIYLGFQMVVLAALRARLKGWRPSGKYRLGRWGLPVNIVALAYGIVAIVNMSWPRTPDAPWYDNWLVPLSAAIVIGLGLLYMAVHRSYGRSTAPYDDAVPKPASPASAPLARTEP